MTGSFTRGVIPREIIYHPPRIISKGKWHTIRAHHPTALPKFQLHFVVAKAKRWSPSLWITIWRMEGSFHRYYEDHEL